MRERQILFPLCFLHCLWSFMGQFGTAQHIPTPGTQASQGLWPLSTELDFTPLVDHFLFSGLILSQTATRSVCKSRPRYLEVLCVCFEAMAVWCWGGGVGTRVKGDYHGKLNREDFMVP